MSTTVMPQQQQQQPSTSSANTTTTTTPTTTSHQHPSYHSHPYPHSSQASSTVVPRRGHAFKGKYVLFDFNDPRSFPVAARLKTLGANVIDTIPEGYATCGFTICCMVRSKHAQSKQASTENSVSLQQQSLPKYISKRSKQLLKASSTSQATTVTTPPNGRSSEEDMTVQAKALGIRVIDFKQLSSVLRKLGELPLDVEFSAPLEGSSHSQRSGASHDGEPAKKMRLYDFHGLHIPLEKVYTSSNSRLSVDDIAPPIFFPRKRKREESEDEEEEEDEDGEEEEEEEQEDGQNEKENGKEQAPAEEEEEDEEEEEEEPVRQVRVKRPKTMKENIYCEVCGAKFACMQEHIESEMHLKLQASNPVWDVLDDIYDSRACLNYSSEEGQLQVSDNLRYKALCRILYKDSRSLHSMPMAYHFANRVLNPDPLESSKDHKHH